MANRGQGRRSSATTAKKEREKEDHGRSGSIMTFRWQAARTIRAKMRQNVTILYSEPLRALSANEYRVADDIKG